MIAEIIWEHTVPGWAIWTAVGIAVLVLVFTAWRYLPLNLTVLLVGLLRVLFFAALAWCLLMPLDKHTHSEILRPRFLVLLDSSKSMALSPKAGVPSRWAEAQRVLKEPWVKAVGQKADVELYPFADTLGSKMNLPEASHLSPDGGSTLLRDSLRKAVERYRGQRLAGILLLTDGIDTRESATHWASENWLAPIYTVRLEPSMAWQIAPEVQVERVDTPRRVVVGWDSKVTAMVSAQGTQGKAFTVQLQENGKLVQELPTQIPAEGGRREIVFHVEHPAVGNYLYAVNIPPLEGEIQTNDNSYAVSVQVIDTKNRVLFVEGLPRWESKYLNRALQGIKDITPLTFLRGPDNKLLTIGQRGSMTIDLTPEQLAQYKIVILGDLDAEVLTEPRAKALAKFVEDGGSLVLLGGPTAWGEKGFSATALAKLMPVRRSTSKLAVEGKFPVSLTDEGRAHPAFTTADSVWKIAPPVLSIFTDVSLTPGAVALVTAQTPNGPQPLIATARYGQGKMAAIMTDSLWRWQLNPGKEQPYQHFWSQMVQWLKPAEETKEALAIDLFADTDQQFLGENVNLGAVLGGTEAATVKDVAVTCEIQTPDNRRIPFPMSKQNVTTASGKTFPGYGLAFTPQAPGLHRAMALATAQGRKIESAPFTFFIKPFTPESNPRPADIDLLKALAESSGGKFLDPEEADKTLSALKFEAGEEERINYTSLWNQIPVLACLMGLLSLEWAVRKFKNMA